MAKAKPSGDVQHVTMTVEELAAFVEGKIREATGRAVAAGDGPPALPLHRQHHDHGPVVSVLLAIGAHVGLHYTEGGHSPFDVAMAALVGAGDAIESAVE